jgi:kynurenine formamidase
MVAYKGAPMDGGQEVSGVDVIGALKKQGMSADDIGKGDVVMFHTGWVRYWIKDNKKYNGAVPEIGLEVGKWLTAKGVVIVGSDTWPVEVVPTPNPKLAFPVHQHLITKNGTFIHENAATELLAAVKV